MADVTKSVNIRVSAEDAASGPLAKVRQGITAIEQTIGRRSTFGKLTEIAIGGGAVFAASRALGDIARVSETAAKMVDQFREGEIGAGEVADQIARTIPLLGHVYAAGAGIYELVTGEAVEREKIARAVANENDILKIQAGVVADQLATWGKIADTRKEASDYVEGQTQKRALAAAPPAFRETLQIQFDAKNEQKKLLDQRKADLKAIEDEYSNFLKTAEGKKLQEVAAAPLPKSRPGVAGFDPAYEAAARAQREAQKILDDKEEERVNRLAAVLAGYREKEKAAALSAWEAEARAADNAFQKIGDAARRVYGDSLDYITRFRDAARKTLAEQTQQTLEDNVKNARTQLEAAQEAFSKKTTQARFSSGNFQGLQIQVAQEKAQSDPQVNLLRQQVEQARRSLEIQQGLLDVFRQALRNAVSGGGDNYVLIPGVF